MTLILQRTECKLDGIFSELRDVSGDALFLTLEHAYQDPLGGFQPKLPDGEYLCVRGMHKLKAMHDPFETFEVTKVPGHTGILFHVGNFNFDSDGCILVGHEVKILNGHQALTQSRASFEQFMNLLTGYDEFTLIVKSY
jgi:hypothetical protein